MKKLLIATTALVATAGVASADMKLSGYGRFGLDYFNSPVSGVANTQINLRTRINIDGSVETDSGVTFGTRIRIQYSSGQTDNPVINNLVPSSTTTVFSPVTGLPIAASQAITTQTSAATLNAAMLYATYQGMRLEVGNANTAYDSVALMYNSEIGYLDRSTADPQGSFFAYASTPYRNSPNRMGVFFSYAISGFTGRISYITLDQTAKNPADLFDTTTGFRVGREQEVSISGDYVYNQFTIAAAYVHNGAGVPGNQQFFIGGEYAFSPAGNVGLQYFNNGDASNSPLSDDGRQLSLYGNFTQGPLTYKGYVAYNDGNANQAPGRTRTTFGVGADYDLGGARLSGDISRTNTKRAQAGLGVRFDF